MTYNKLITYRSIPPNTALNINNRRLYKPFQSVEMDESVLDRLHIDTRAMDGGIPDHSTAQDLPGGRFQDEWGIVYRPAYSSGHLLYYTTAHSPLSNTDVARLLNYEWPNPLDPGRTRGLREKARKLHEETDKIVVGHHGDTGMFETARDLRGMAEFLMDLMRNKDYAHALLEKICAIQCAKMAAYLAEVGDYLDVVCFGDDVCGQDRPLISPKTYREMVKP